jgi:hypothetical protein
MEMAYARLADAWPGPRSITAAAIIMTAALADVVTGSYAATGRHA